MDKIFPRYTEFDPLVPVWCVTPNRKGCMHRFFDTSPISPSGKYLAVFQISCEDREPEPGEKGQVVIVDLETGEDRVVAESCGWEHQMGANINWGKDDHQLFFNDVDTKTWQPFAWKYDVITDEKMKMEGPLYHASEDGKWLISANMTTMRKIQPGYGVRIPQELARWNKGPVDDDGFYLTDTETGKTKLLISIKEILEKADPPALFEEPEKLEIYGFHSKFNTQCDMMMLSVRAYKCGDEPQWDMFAKDHSAVKFAWVTVPLDASWVSCSTGPEQWGKSGHHGTWFPDGRRISMNLNIDSEEHIRFVQVNYDGSDLRKITDKVWGSGHPTVHPDGKHILTDTYTHDFLAFGDGTIPLRWVNIETGEDKTLVRINTQTNATWGVLRVDPHPAWTRDWHYVTFNAFVDGTRKVFIADMKDVFSL
jgi:hypothetical protein